ncbi:MAG TPA: hypothetical protein VIA64_18205 [Burkholderiales bacterium]|jgi:hypothetical protein
MRASVGALVDALTTIMLPQNGYCINLGPPRDSPGARGFRKLNFHMRAWNPNGCGGSAATPQISA